MMALTRVLLMTLCATTSFALPLPQHSGLVSSDGVFQAYTPGGQYSNGQQILRPQRLVLARPGQQAGRGNQVQVLKRVRVQPQQQQQQYYYAAESPVNIAEPVPVLRQQAQPQAEATYIQQQQPAYYVQRQPTQVITTVGQKGLKAVPKQQQLVQEEAEEEYPPDLNPSYNFSFDVKDDDLTNYQNRQEERDGNVVKGSYSVIDPDGYVRTVTYTADSKNGFQAKVTREPTDVKIKFPEATPAPVEEQPVYKPRAAIRAQQPVQYPQYQQQVVYQQQPQAYAGTEAEPTYVLRRVPGSGNAQRLVKVVRQ